MESSSQSIYTPLRTTTSTRLLTLHPGSGRGPIHASLRQVDLADDPEFEAVSYTWGEDTIKKTVVINGRKTLVWNNLWTFLKVLRHKTQPRTLWTDAISIYQTNADEKAHQTGIIDKVFMYATGVVAWVGEHADGSETLFRPWPTPMPFIFEGVPIHKTRGLSGNLRKFLGHDESYFREKSATCERAGAGANLATTATTAKMAGLCLPRVFLSNVDSPRNWRCRKVVRLLWMDWSQLITSRWQGKDVFDDISLDKDDLRILRQLENIRVGYRAGMPKRLNIFELGEQFYDQRCKETKDRIFALLSLESRKPGETEIAAKNYRLELTPLAVHILDKRRRHVNGFRQLDTLFDLLNMDEDKEMDFLKVLKRKADAAGAEEYWKTLYYKKTRHEDRAVFEEDWDPNGNLMPIYAPSLPRRRGRDNTSTSKAVQAKIKEAHSRPRRFPSPEDGSSHEDNSHSEEDSFTDSE